MLVCEYSCDCDDISTELKSLIFSRALSIINLLTVFLSSFSLFSLSSFSARDAINRIIFSSYFAYSSSLIIGDCCCDCNSAIDIFSSCDE